MKPLAEAKYAFKTLELKHNSLIEEFSQLTKLHEDLIYKWKEGLKRVERQEEERKALIASYEDKIKFYNENTRKEELRLLQENNKLKVHFDHLKKEMMKELKLKELIVDRHNQFEEVLKKELTMAKNIIKNPALLKRGERQLNFDNLDLYTFRNSDQEVQHNTIKEPISLRLQHPPLDFSKKSITPNLSKHENLKISPRTEYSMFQPYQLNPSRRSLKKNRKVS